MKPTLTGLNREIGGFSKIIGDFISMPHFQEGIDKDKRSIRKYRTWNMDQLDLTDMYRTLYSTVADTHFSYMLHMEHRIDHMLDQQEVLI